MFRTRFRPRFCGAFCSRVRFKAALPLASVLVSSLILSRPLAAQNAPSTSSALPDAPQARNEQITALNTPKHTLQDQAAIWTSPARIRKHDLIWLAPLAAATSVSILEDHHTMADVVSHNAQFNQDNVNTSNVLVGGFIAAPVVLYGWGHFENDEHAREAGILGSEALVDGVIVEQGMKLIFWRERPSQDNARGLFFQGKAGPDSSFPSSHSMVAWSAASLLAAEYPSRWNQIGIYTLATGLSMTRVLGQQHFPTDALIGSVGGWLIGRYVYRVHHRYQPAAR